MKGGGYEPRFDRNYAFGRQGELLNEDYLQWIAQGDARVETKRKSYIDLELYIELEHDPGRRGTYRPSGINVTESEVWSFVIADTGISLFVPVHLLRDACSHSSAKDKAETDGSCPTRGKLINVGLLVHLAKAART